MVVEPIKKQRREKPVTIIEMDSVKDHPDRIDLCKIKWNDSIVAIPFKPIDFSKNIKDDNNELIVIPIKGDICWLDDEQVQSMHYFNGTDLYSIKREDVRSFVNSKVNISTPVKDLKSLYKCCAPNGAANHWVTMIPTEDLLTVSSLVTHTDNIF